MMQMVIGTVVMIALVLDHDRGDRHGDGHDHDHVNRHGDVHGGVEKDDGSPPRGGVDSDELSGGDRASTGMEYVGSHQQGQGEMQ